MLHYGRAMTNAVTTRNRKISLETEHVENSKVIKSTTTGYKHVGSRLGAYCCSNFRKAWESTAFLSETKPSMEWKTNSELCSP